MPTKKTYSISEVAARLGITRQAVHKAIKRQLLQAERGTFTETIVRKGWIITSDALETYRKRYGVSSSHQERGKKT